MNDKHNYRSYWNKFTTQFVEIIFENRVLLRTFGSKMKWREAYNEKLHYSSLICGDPTKAMRLVEHAERLSEMVNILFETTEGRRWIGGLKHRWLDNIKIYITIYVLKISTGLILCRSGSRSGCYVHCNELLVSTKKATFVNSSVNIILKNNSVPCSYLVSWLTSRELDLLAKDEV